MANDTRPTFRLPEGYTSEEEFLSDFRDEFTADDSADFDNHAAGVEDLEFLVGNQWDEEVKAQRAAARKPSLTINRMPAFIGQVVGKRRQNETEVHIVPTVGGTQPVAQVREGLIRSIQKESKAKFAYDNALTGAASCGIGNFQITTQYENDDVWDQCMRVDPINDHFSVIWDRTLNNPTGKDADHVSVVDNMPWKLFKEKWPWATPSDIIQTRFSGELQSTGWFTKADVRVCSYWKMRHKKRVLALMNDNSTRDITDISDPAVLSQIQSRPDGSPFIRTVDRPFAQRYVVTGVDILEGPYELPIDRVPIFRVPGWEIRIGEKVYRWGLLRFLKDPQRLHNYWRSVIAEKIMRSPKTTWMASNTAVAGREQTWRDSATSDDPLLIWNQESGQKPERIAPVQVEGALIEQASTTTQDMKDVSNIHEANLGMPSNEVSGRGIEAREAVSETGTALYHDNLNEAIEEGGRVMNMLLPVIYDMPRVVKIIMPDGKEQMQAINQLVGDQGKLDISQGKYTVTATTGRSYDSKRQESSESMLSLAQSMPEVLSVGADIIVEAMDWPDAPRLAKRLRNSIPPNLLSPEDRTPEQNAAMQASQQAGGAQQQADATAQAAKTQKDRADSLLSLARAQNYGTQAALAPAKLQNESLQVASEANSRELHDSLEATRVATGA